MEVNRIYNEDCLEGKRKMAEQGIKVDLVLTEPPYGTTACKWDTIIPFGLMWECINNIAGRVVLFGTEPFTSKLINSNIENFT